MDRFRGAERGFSLLELLVAVAMVVTLASVAVPAYTQYQLRAQAAEFITAAAPHRLALDEWAQLHPGQTQWPSDASVFAFKEHVGKHVAAVSYGRAGDASIAYIEVAGTLQEQPVRLIYQATLVAAATVRWDCRTDVATRQFFPSSCGTDPAAGI